MARLELPASIPVVDGIGGFDAGGAVEADSAVCGLQQVVVSALAGTRDGLQSEAVPSCFSCHYAPFHGSGP